MCIIAIKPTNKTLFTDDMIRTMFTNNPDGSGYMFPHEGKVMIRKGFMNVDSLLSSIHSLPNIDNLPIIMHFRIGTHGGNTEANTHPFPISGAVNALQACKVRCDLGMVHNGVIHLTTPRKGISDTMEYILDVVQPLKELCKTFYKKEQGRSILENTIGTNRLAFLDGKGEIETIGDFVEHDGYTFSNTSYEPKKVYATPPIARGYSSYDDYGDQYGYSKYVDGCWEWIPSREKEIVKKLDTNFVMLCPIPFGAFVDMTGSEDMPILDVLDTKYHAMDNQYRIYEIGTDGIARIATEYIGRKVYDINSKRLTYGWKLSKKYVLGGK